MVAATSSALPMRPSGRRERVDSSTSSRVWPRRAAIWSAKPAGRGPLLVLHRPGRHGVDQHALARPQVGEQPAERELGRLGHRVGGVEVARGAPSGRRGHVHDPAAARRGHRRRERAHQAHRRHHVQVPLVLPVLVAQLFERPGPARAGVVHQRPGRLGTGGEDALGRVGPGHVELEVAAGARHAQHARALLREDARGGRADAARATGDNADPAVQIEVHRTE